jgi:hypothetical protein
MKRVLLVLLVALLSVSGVQAQESLDYNKIRFGAYVAPTLSWMRPTSTKSDDKMYGVENGGSKMGFQYGFVAEYYFAENYGLVLGAQVNHTGGSINAKLIDSAGKKAGWATKANMNYNLQYVEIPVAIKLRTDEISNMRFFGQFGISLGVNIGKKVTYDMEGYDANMNLVDYVSDGKEKLSASSGTAISPVLLQMNVGAGLEYPFAPKLSGYVGIFFNNGFLPDVTSPSNYKGLPAFKDGNVRLNNFALRLGMLF